MSLDPDPIERALAAFLASGRGPAFARRWLFSRLDKSPGLAAAYDALRRVERAAGRTAGLSTGQKELLEDLILGAVARGDGGALVEDTGAANTARDQSK